MDLESLVLLVAGKYPVVGVILMCLGALIVCAQAVVVLTPSKADDAAWEKIKSIPVLGSLISVVAKLAPIQKK